MLVDTLTYTPFLIVLSIVIAVAASYTALALVGRVIVAQGDVQYAWLAVGTVALGIGGWCMNFVGLLAYRPPVDVSYDGLLLLLSVGMSVVAAGVAMYTISRPVLGVGPLVRGALALGMAIVGMRDIGMVAMHMDTQITDHPTVLALSILTTVGASIIALWLAFRFRTAETWMERLYQGTSGLIMGVAIIGMHYVGIFAAGFPAVVDGSQPYISGDAPRLHGTALAIMVAAASAVILGIALASAAIDRHRRSLISAHERERLQQCNIDLECRVQARTAEFRAALADAELANQTKSEFLARMSHELRTPLNAVIGFAHVLTKNKSGHLQDQDLVYVQRIAENGRRLLSIINGILDLSQIGADRTKLSVTPTALDMVIRGVVAHLTRSASGRPITIETDIPAFVALIDTDAEQVRQVLVHLADNALKFTEAGTVTVRLVADPDTGRPLRIEVTDTGIGIPPETLQRIFTPFEQGDNTMTRRFGGTGIGLAISRSLCDLLGYSLTVTSIVGSGTTMTIVIPGVQDYACAA